MIPTAEIAPIEERKIFLKNLKLPTSVKTLQRNLGFLKIRDKTSLDAPAN